MHGWIRISLIAQSLFLAACTEDLPSADTVAAESHVDCAALISAATQLAQKKELTTDADFDRRALFSGMTHLNSHAVPAGLSEKQAFELLNARRAELIKSTAPDDILARAKACIERTPGG